jgi:hypothetical protein
MLPGYLPLSSQGTHPAAPCNRPEPPNAAGVLSATRTDLRGCSAAAYRAVLLLQALLGAARWARKTASERCSEGYPAVNIYKSPGTMS